jgi:hypothetical protein
MASVSQEQRERQDYRSQHCKLFPESCYRYNGQLNSKIFESHQRPALGEAGQREPQQQQDQIARPSPTKLVTNSKFNAPEKKKSVSHEQRESEVIDVLKDNLPLQQLKYRKVAKVAMKDDANLQQLQDDMFLISGKQDVPNYEEILAGKKFRVYTNDAEGKLRITFEGSKGTPEDINNVLNVIKNKKLVGKDIEEEEAFLAELFKNGSKKVMFEGKEYSDIKMLGHSLGAFKARKYGAKYGVDSELLNAHIMPWNEFGRTAARTDMHTIITDPLDLKYLIQPTDKLSHTYYQPLESTELKFAKQRIGESSEPAFIDPHYDVSWQNLDRQDQSEIAELLKTKYPSILANTGIAALGIAGSIYEASTNKDYDPRTDPMLGGANEAGVVGFNIDPDYQWGDTAPSSPADWLIWKALQPITKAIASSSNPVQDLALDKKIEQESGTTLSSKLYTFTYKGDEYFYQKDNLGNPTWFSDNGAPLDQAVKDAYAASLGGG